jgi:hypothetical protein
MSHRIHFPPRRPLKPVSGTIQIYLRINGQLYAARPMQTDPAVTKRAWRLRKADGRVYDVRQTPFGPECDCPDFIFRHSHTPGGCKHCMALVAATLI